MSVAPPRVERAARAFAFAIAATFAFLTYTLYVGESWAIGAWPWPEKQMSFVFLASIAASIGAIWLSIAVTRELAALAGVGINIVVASLGASFYLTAQAWSAGRGDLFVAALVSALSAAFGLWLWRWARRLDARDPRPMPAFLQWAFVVFVVTLVGAGLLLVLQRQVFPWRLSDQTATLFGLIFLGAAAYFAHALARGRWAFTLPPLLGFLAYDLVLFVPYFKMLADAGVADDIYGGEPVNRTSLVIYLAVLTSSTLLALYAVLLHPTTRWRAATTG